MTEPTPTPFDPGPTNPMPSGPAVDPVALDPVAPDSVAPDSVAANTPASVTLPGADEDPAAWSGWAALGVPDDPQAYELVRPTLPDGLPYDEALEGTFREAAARLKLTPWQAQGLLETFSGYQAEAFTTHAHAAQDGGAALEADLRQDWGGAYDANLDLARRAAHAFSDDGTTMEALTRAMGDAQVVRFFHRLGGMMAEDSLGGESESGYGLSPDGARAEVARLNQQLAGLLSKDDVASRHERQSLEDRRRALLARAYPSA